MCKTTRRPKRSPVLTVLDVCWTSPQSLRFMLLRWVSRVRNILTLDCDKHMANITKAERERRAAEVEAEAEARAAKKAAAPVPAKASAPTAPESPCVLMHRDGKETEVRRGASVEIMLGLGWELRA